METTSDNSKVILTADMTVTKLPLPVSVVVAEAAAEVVAAEGEEEVGEAEEAAVTIQMPCSQGGEK